jgi:hypothetical protein
MPSRDFLIEVSALAFIILGAVCALAFAGVVSGHLVGADGFQKDHRALFVAIVIVPALLTGIPLGLVTWVWCLRRRVALDEMVRVMRHPGTPQWLSVALERLVVWAYG